MTVSARPVGAYQIKGDQVTWVPAVDVSRIVIMGQIVGIIAALVIRSNRAEKERLTGASARGSRRQRAARAGLNVRGLFQWRRRTEIAVGEAIAPG